MAIRDYPITSKFKEFDNMHPQGHTGTDYAMQLYTPLEALEDSTVISISTNDILGNNIRLKTPDGKIFVYGHLSSFKVNVGDKLKKGDIIGLSGGMPGMQGAGHSNGPHLHLSVYNSQGVLVDPSPYILNQIEDANTSFVFPIIIILIFIILWKFKKILIYSMILLVWMFIIFLAS